MRALGVVVFVVLACGQGTLNGDRPGRRNLTLLHTADLHSHLFSDTLTMTERDAELGLGPSGETTLVGGAARLASLLDDERSRAERSVVLDAGDLFEGTDVFPAFGGVPEVRIESLLGVDAAALGNHDLAPGLPALRRLREDWATFPLVAANLDAEMAEGLVTDSVVVAKGGLKVAVVGLGRSAEAAPVLGQCVRAVQQAVDFRRPEADVIVVLSHLGRDLDVALVPLTTGIDVILGGHTHDVIFPPLSVLDCGKDLASERGCRPRPVPVVHSGAFGRYLGKVELVVSSDPTDVAAGSGRPSVVLDSKVGLLPVNDAVPERADVVALLEPYRVALEKAGLNRPLVFAPAAVTRDAPHGGDSALGDLVATAMGEVVGADLSIVNSTGLRDDLPAGQLTADELFRVLPFDDELVVRLLTGAQLEGVVRAIASDSCARDRQSQAQIAGGKLTLACDGASSVLEIGGRPIDEAAAYRVATVSFLAESGEWLDVPAAPAPEGDTGTVRAAVGGYFSRLTTCPAGRGLPCFPPAAAVADGRISWK